MRNLLLNTTEDVVAEIMAGTGLGCSAVAKHFPQHRGNGSTLNPSTPHRWMTKGVVLPDGQVLRLEAARVTGRILTSKEALRRFIEAQQAAEVVQAPAPRSPAKRQHAAEKAAADLERLGV